MHMANSQEDILSAFTSRDLQILLAKELALTLLQLFVS